MSKLKKIVLTGGPSSGKTSIIKNLRELVANQITKENFVLQLTLIIF